MVLILREVILAKKNSEGLAGSQSATTAELFLRNAFIRSDSNFGPHRAAEASSTDI